MQDLSRAASHDLIKNSFEVPARREEDGELSAEGSAGTDNGF